MLIDIPVTIIFNDDGSWRAGGSDSRMKRTFTMRYDTDNAVERPAQIIVHYGASRADPFADGEGILFTLMPESADKAIRELVAKFPEDYRAEVEP